MTAQRDCDRFKCLSSSEREFVRKHLARLTKRHPGFRDPGWSQEELKFWVQYYMKEPSNFKDENHKDFVQLPEGSEEAPEGYEAVSAASAVPSPGEASESSGEDSVFMMDAWKAHAVEVVKESINSIEVDRAPKKQVHALRVLADYFVEPEYEEDRPVLNGGININVLTQMINRRSDSKISYKTVERAVERLLKEIESRHGKAGFLRKHRSRKTHVHQEKEMSKVSVIEQTLDKLEAVHARLESGDLSGSVVEEAGYSSVHVARLKTESVFQELHDVSDIAPGLKDERIYGVTFEQARRYLREGMAQIPEKGSPKERTMLAVAKLAEAIRQPSNSFQLAVLSKEVSILLLGPNRLGGVYAEWQTSTLGVGLLSWEEQERLNRRVLGMTRNLDPQQANSDAETFELPNINFVEVGCYGNIAKACFRAIADDELCGFTPDQVLEIGSQSLVRIEREVALDPDQYAEYIPPMYAMEAVLAERIDASKSAEAFWERLPKSRAMQIIDHIKGKEPSEELRELVIKSACKAGVSA